MAGASQQQMANEWVLRYRLSDPIDFTVADGAAITKGTLCALSDPLTAAASTGAADMIAGVAARDKIISDGRTRLALFRNGIFDVFASGAIAVGQPVVATPTNRVKLATVGTSGAAVIGYALETASDNEQFQIMFQAGLGGGSA